MSAIQRTQPSPLFRLHYSDFVRAALAEDLGRAGDLTTDAVVPIGERARGLIVARRAGCLAGLDVAAEAFRALEPTDDLITVIKPLHQDGDVVPAATPVLEIEGSARVLLAAERVALNLLGRLCGIATTTRSLVDAVADHRAAIACTRKTTPGLRALEKYAVRCGGGANHRFGLDDAVLIKDNHRVIAGSAAEAVRRARAHVGHLVKIEVEIDDIAELEPVLALGVDAVLLDNMSTDELRQAVEINAGRAVLEASGGITPDTASAIAATGVDLLSVGWLTHSSPALDVGFDFLD
ncbi:MAG: carboxylating nicotinate-nucleotide diphosphorylase [Acidobacteriota bacterium]